MIFVYHFCISFLYIIDEVFYLFKITMAPIKMQPLSSLLKNRKGFFISVYATLFLQLFITFAIVYFFRLHPKLSNISKQSFIFYLLLSLCLMLILVLVPLPIWLKFFIFTFFAMVIGAMLHNATWMVPADLITQALAGTMSIFVSLSIVGIILAMMGIDLGWMGLILLGSLIGLLIASILLMVFDKNKTNTIHKVLLVIGLILFSIYVIYDTNIIMQRNYKGDFITASIDFYLDIINIFIRMLILDGAQ